MTMLVQALLAAFGIMLASLVGVLFLWHGTEKWMFRNLRYLISCSAGVFSVTAANLVLEAYEAGISWFMLLGGMLLGMLALELGSRIIPRAHHHHAPDGTHAHSRLDARRMLMGDAIHNFGDGILLVPAFLADVRLGVATALAIFLHEMVQEVSEFFVLKEAGFTTRRALSWSFTVSGTILIGVAISNLLADTSVALFLVAFAGGGFLYVVLRDLLPSIIRSVTTRQSSAPAHLFSYSAGFFLMLSMVLAFAHT